jgi:HlyD family type I secretion membrane fusion protein
MTSRPEHKTATMRPSRDPIILKSALLCAVGFGGFTLWAATAPLEEGVAASGQVVVEDNRQVVQHLEGGIVAEIHVRDGQQVRAGDTLLVLQDTAFLANRDQLVQEFAALSASVARLTALRDGAARPDFSELDGLALGEAERLDIETREGGLFEQQRAALSADVAVLQSRIQASRGLISARAGQIVIAQKALAAAREERDVMSAMLAQQLARRDQLASAERLVATLEGDIARLESERADQAATVTDLTAQIRQARTRAAQDVAATLLETSAELLAARERLGAAQDVLDRSVITAPVDGEVLNLAFSTLGGVVGSGETILEVVPEIQTVTASVRIDPSERSSVRSGQTVRTQFSSYRGWQAPRLQGEIVGVSADLKTDPATSVPYYEARVRVPASEMALTTDVDIRPGMPVDVFIYSGHSRTLGEYLLEPLSESLFRGLRTS